MPSGSDTSSSSSRSRSRSLAEAGAGRNVGRVVVAAGGCRPAVARGRGRSPSRTQRRRCSCCSCEHVVAVQAFAADAAEPEHDSHRDIGGVVVGQVVVVQPLPANARGSSTMRLPRCSCCCCRSSSRPSCCPALAAIDAHEETPVGPVVAVLQVVATQLFPATAGTGAQVAAARRTRRYRRRAGCRDEAVRRDRRDAVHDWTARS